MKVTQGNLTESKRIYKKAREHYYNGDPIMTDAVFDKLEDGIRKLDPEWKELAKTGVRTKNKKQEVELLHFMPSLGKQYPKDLPKWKERPINKAVKKWGISAKLDGTSLQLAYRGGRPWKLITRGDGTLGKDISYFLPHLVKLGVIPASIKTQQLVVVFRCEGMMEKSVFDKKWSKEALGDKEGFDNPRNMVNGLFNRQDMHPALKSVQLVVLGVFGLTQADGLVFARRNHFDVVHYAEPSGSLDAQHLTGMLEEWRTESAYEMDGLVLVPARQPLVYENADKPDWATAFKVNDEENAPVVEVTEVTWERTRTNRWQPLVHITPTRMDGVTVRKATAHNAAWMKERGIGKGALIKVVRSGGVIPKILEDGVVKKAKFQPPPGAYEFRGRYCYAIERNHEVEVQALLHFMRTMKIEHLAEKTIARLYDEGFTTAESYVKLAARQTNYLTRFGFGSVMSAKIINELQRVLLAQVSLRTLMVASGCFENGIGDRKLKLLEGAGISMNDLFRGKGTDLYQKILNVHGFSTKTAKAVVDGKLAFVEWFSSIKDLVTVDGSLPAKKKVAAQGSQLAGVQVAWTGYRNKDEEAIVEANGGEVGKLGSKTKVLLFNPDGKFMDKVERAAEKGVTCVTWADFCKKYNIKG